MKLQFRSLLWVKRSQPVAEKGCILWLTVDFGLLSEKSMYINHQNDKNQGTDLTRPSIFILSAGFFKAFTGKYDISKLSDPIAVRDIGSISTLAFEHALVEAFGAGYLEITKTYPDIDSFMCVLENAVNASDGAAVLATEIKSIISTGNTEETRNRAIEFLTRKPKDPNEVEAVSSVFDFKVETSQVPYKVAHAGRNIYIIVEEGILSHLEGKPFRLDFLRAVLKALYSLARIHNVNRGSWYRSYIGVLSTSVGL